MSTPNPDLPDSPAVPEATTLPPQAPEAAAPLPPETSLDNAAISAITDDVQRRARQAWQLMIDEATATPCNLSALGEIYLAEGDKKGVKEMAMHLLMEGGVDEAQRLTATTGEPLASKDFQEEGDSLLRDRNFSGAIKAYRAAALPAKVSEAVFKKVLTEIEAAVKEGSIVIVQHTDYDECDAASAYCQAYEAVHGQPPSPEQLIGVGDSARQRRVMQNFFGRASSEVAGRISKAPTTAEHNQRSKDCDRLQQDMNQRLFRRDMADFLADDSEVGRLNRKELTEGYEEQFDGLAKMCKRFGDTESMKLLIARAEEDRRWDKALELRSSDAFKQGNENTMWPDSKWFEKAIDDHRSAHLYVDLCKAAGFTDKLNAAGEKALKEAAARGLKAMPEDDENFIGIPSSCRRTFISFARECFKGAGNAEGLVKTAELMWRLGTDAHEVSYIYGEAKMPPPDDPAFYKKLGEEWTVAFKARFGSMAAEHAKEAMYKAHAAFVKYVELSGRQTPPAAPETPVATAGQGPAETAGQNPVEAAPAGAAPAAPTAPEALKGQGV